MTIRSALRRSAIAFALLAPFAGVAMAGVLDDVKSRGELIVGVKADYPPFGYRDASGQIVGMELDLAKDLADRLGVKLRLWPVSASSRIQFLEQGSIDLVIATMAVTDERKRRVGFIEPNYYASGVALLARRDAGIKSAGDLAGKSICMIRDSYFADGIAARAAGSVLVPLRSLWEGETALLAGKCAAFVEENARLIYLKNGTADKWRDFEVVRLDFEPLPWAIAVQTQEKDAAFGKLISAAIADWHKSGKLLELEKKWLGENTKWLLERQNQ